MSTSDRSAIVLTWTPTSWPKEQSASPTPAPIELLTLSQAGDYLRTGERFVRRLIAERRIPYVKLDKYVRLQRSTLDVFIESGRIPRRRTSADR